MRTLIVRAALLAGCLFIVGCASRPLPKYEQPLARAAVMKVRTTAYTHTEADHTQYSNRNALGGTLRCGPIHSAAADWSRWPAGSIFRIRETGEIFEVDDYGWALSGTNTIDLYKRSRASMNTWGVRRVTIENLRWGDPKRSLSVLRPRSKYPHIKRMVDQLEDRMPQWTSEGYSPQIAAAAPSAPEPVATLAAEPAVLKASPVTKATPVRKAVVAEPAAQAVAVQPFNRVPAAQAVSPQPVRTAQTTSKPSGTAATREAFLNSIR
jgi:3D (Asp-Asp-Asp) domain-containing protein